MELQSRHLLPLHFSSLPSVCCHFIFHTYPAFVATSFFIPTQRLLPLHFSSLPNSPYNTFPVAVKSRWPMSLPSYLDLHIDPSLPSYLDVHIDPSLPSYLDLHIVFIYYWTCSPPENSLNTVRWTLNNNYAFQ